MRLRSSPSSGWTCRVSSTRRLRQITSCHVTSRHATSCHVTPCHAVSHHTTSDLASHHYAHGSRPAPRHVVLCYIATWTSLAFRQVAHTMMLEQQATPGRSRSFHQCLRQKHAPPGSEKHGRLSSQSTKSKAGEQFLLLDRRARARLEGVLVSQRLVSAGLPFD